ncbi:hypothetical protein D3C76_920220 [compost metagenome]
MGDAGEHQLTLAPGLFDILGHLVEGAVHLGHLAGRVADRQAHAAPLTELASRKHQALERLVQLTHEYPRRRGRQQANGQEPAEHVPDLLTPQRMRIQRHLQPPRPQAGGVHPQRWRRMDAQAHFGVVAQFGLHLPLVDLAVRPMLLALGHTGAGHADQACGLGDLFAVFLIGSPVGTQGQRHAMAVLAIDQHVFVHQQIDQRQRLGKQHDDQHQPQGAGEKTLREPQRRFHRWRLLHKTGARHAREQYRPPQTKQGDPFGSPCRIMASLQAGHHLPAFPSGTKT